MFKETQLGDGHGKKGDKCPQSAEIRTQNLSIFLWCNLKWVLPQLRNWKPKNESLKPLKKRMNLLLKGHWVQHRRTLEALSCCDDVMQCHEYRWDFEFLREHCDDEEKFGFLIARLPDKPFRFVPSRNGLNPAFVGFEANFKASFTLLRS